MISRKQIRAARALAEWTQDKLAEETGLSLIMIKRIEGGRSDPRSTALYAIQQAFVRAGIVFLDDGDTRDGGPGVRLERRVRREN